MKKKKKVNQGTWQKTNANFEASKSVMRKKYKKNGNPK